MSMPFCSAERGNTLRGIVAADPKGWELLADYLNEHGHGQYVANSQGIQQQVLKRLEDHKKARYGQMSSAPLSKNWSDTLSALADRQRGGDRRSRWRLVQQVHLAAAVQAADVKSDASSAVNRTPVHNNYGSSPLPGTSGPSRRQSQS
ncbi:hypothetical protein ACWD3J_49690 [Streptomyces sp. NPDC002755]|uniref:hypothetical protein n=1 Tax=Streptomyces sp. NPDC002884 TaxID=3154544 RepID=UPI00331F6372